MPQAPEPMDNQRRNSELIQAFRDWRAGQGAGAEELEAHEFNLDFYLNHYLQFGSSRGAADGASPDLVRDFLGDFFVHKAMWTDVEEQKSSIASLLAFYCWLEDKGEVPPGSCRGLTELVEAEKEAWFAAMDRYAVESLESWQAGEDGEFLDQLPFSDLDIPDDQFDEPAFNDFADFEIPGLEEALRGQDDEAIAELPVSDEAENDPR